MPIPAVLRAQTGQAGQNAAIVGRVHDMTRGAVVNGCVRIDSGED
jgi:hypothetical protein